MSNVWSVPVKSWTETDCAPLHVDAEVPKSDSLQVSTNEHISKKTTQITRSMRFQCWWASWRYVCQESVWKWYKQAMITSLWRICQIISFSLDYDDSEHYSRVFRMLSHRTMCLAYIQSRMKMMMMIAMIVPVPMIAVKLMKIMLRVFPCFMQVLYILVPAETGRWRW